MQLCSRRSATACCRRVAHETRRAGPGDFGVGFIQTEPWSSNAPFTNIGFSPSWRYELRLQAHFEQAQIIFREGRPRLLRLRASNPDDGSEHERNRETPPSSATSAAAHPLKEAQ